MAELDEGARLVTRRTTGDLDGEVADVDGDLDGEVEDLDGDLDGEKEDRVAS